MTLPVKLGIGTVALGSVSAIGYAGSSYFLNNTEQQGTTINTLINKEYKHILLKISGDEDKNYWETNWNKYKTESQRLDTDIFGLTGWKKVNPTDLTTQLKEKCSQLINEFVLDNSNTTYQNVTKYCARNVTVKDQAEKEGLTIINNSNVGDIWSEMAKKKTDLATHFSKLGIIASSNGDFTASDIKAGCEKSVTKNKSENDYQASYESYKKVCTKDK